MQDFLLDYRFLKSMHLIFVVTWFAGLFYIVRLFIYHAEADKKLEPEKSILIRQYKIMQKRLWYIITWPSMIITVVVASTLLFVKGEYFAVQPFMLLKLGFVFLLILYHLGCQRIYAQLQKDKVKYSSMQLRIWNEVATLLLFVIVFLIVYQTLDFYKGIIGFFILGILLTVGIKWYKKVRKEDETEENEEETIN